MPWKKSPPELVAAFERLVPKTRSVERRPMFGYPAAFVNGKMFAGLHEDRLVVRLDEEGIAEAKKRGATDFEPMAGRPMKGWVAVPQRALTDEALARGWVERALAHVAALSATTKRGGAPKGTGGSRRRR